VTINRRVDCNSEAFTNIFSGVTVNGTQINEMGAAAYSAVDYYSSINTSTGVSVAPTVTSTFLECKSSVDIKIAIGEFSTALDLTNLDITGSSYAEKTVSPTYTAGNFYLDYIVTFNSDDIDTPNLYSIAILNDDDSTEAFWRYLFDSAVNFQSKRFKNLTIRKSWSRYY